ncbi:hypothetical protein ACFYKX_11880 [Cytobacillus sp. FJAT-54145]|uniref:Uncharacterized protein n=1 Tax=Cytobacillus spartinae TaxID=3299023 RepID=A0ABW6KBK4_9BACI
MQDTLYTLKEVMSQTNLSKKEVEALVNELGLKIPARKHKKFSDYDVECIVRATSQPEEFATAVIEEEDEQEDMTISAAPQVAIPSATPTLVTPSSRKNPLKIFSATPLEGRVLVVDFDQDFYTLRWLEPEYGLDILHIPTSQFSTKVGRDTSFTGMFTLLSLKPELRLDEILFVEENHIKELNALNAKMRDRKGNPSTLIPSLRRILHDLNNREVEVKRTMDSLLHRWKYFWAYDEEMDAFLQELMVCLSDPQEYQTQVEEAKGLAFKRSKENCLEKLNQYLSVLLQDNNWNGGMEQAMYRIRELKEKWGFHETLETVYTMILPEVTSVVSKVAKHPNAYAFEQNFKQPLFVENMERFIAEAKSLLVRKKYVTDLEKAFQKVKSLHVKTH